jgi:hypothetical protein
MNGRPSRPFFILHLNSASTIADFRKSNKSIRQIDVEEYHKSAAMSEYSLGLLEQIGPALGVLVHWGH